MTTPSPKAPPRASTPSIAMSGDRVNGVYDVPAPGRISGWAIDRADPEASVQVEIRRAGVLVGAARAERHRPDLERTGVGTGRYGFSIEIDPPVEPEMAFALDVRAITADGLSGRLRGIGAAAPSGDPARRLQERTFQEIAGLRADLADIRQVVDRPVTDIRGHAEVEEIQTALDRIELVQARLDLSLVPLDLPAAPSSTGAGLRWAVIMALGLSALALALGLYSVFA